MRSKLFVITILFLFPLALLAQSAEKVYMHKGNKEFLRKNYAGAETYYRKALEQNAQNSRARYNLGNTLLFQQKPKEAMQEYEKLQMEICILKFVLSQIINIAVNEMIYM